MHAAPNSPSNKVLIDWSPPACMQAPRSDWVPAELLLFVPKQNKLCCICFLQVLKHSLVLLCAGDSSVDPSFTVNGSTIWGTRYFSAWYAISASNMGTTCSNVASPSFCPMTANQTLDIPPALDSSYLSWVIPYCLDIEPPGMQANSHTNTCNKNVWKQLHHLQAFSKIDYFWVIISGWCLDAWTMSGQVLVTWDSSCVCTRWILKIMSASDFSPFKHVPRDSLWAWIDQKLDQTYGPDLLQGQS